MNVADSFERRGCPEIHRPLYTRVLSGGSVQERRTNIRANTHLQPARRFGLERRNFAARVALPGVICSRIFGARDNLPRELNGPRTKRHYIAEKDATVRHRNREGWS